MNTSTQKYQSIHYAPGSLLLGILLMSAPFAANTADSFQMKTLFEPGEATLQAEARGRVMIYDGLDEEIVDRALDKQFDRIEHMMFTRIRHSDPNGSITVQDDGC